MQRSDRHRVIIRAVDGGFRTIRELSALTGISPVTVRRDLTELAEQGALQRVRGGAAAAVRRGAEYPFGLRQNTDADVKLRLAEVAATMVNPGNAVLLDNGTTALAAADRLAGLGVTALALSLHAAAALARKPGNQVIVPGGPVDHEDLAFTSIAAADAVRGMHFDIALLGACAADPDSGLTVAGWADAQVKRAALGSARKVVLIATADKFTRTAAHRFGGLDDLDVIITTSDAPATLTYEARTKGIDVHLIDLGSPSEDR